MSNIYDAKNRPEIKELMKPRIYISLGKWACTGPIEMLNGDSYMCATGVGDTPLAAYNDWKTFLR